MKRISFLTLVFAVLLLSPPAIVKAAMISFDPLTQNVTAGSAANVALLITGLGEGQEPSLGAFDLAVHFDHTIIAFSSLSFGDPALGDQLDLGGVGSVSGFDAGTPGIVNLFEVSLDSPADLDSLQAGSFILATLAFNGLAPGASSLNISINALGDALGDSLSAEIASGSINVAVPLPGAVWLLATALAGLAGLRKRFGK